MSEYYDYNIYADCLGRYISTISMPLFVFISGYIYHFLRANYQKYPNYKILIKKKWRRLMVPYLILAPIYIYFLLDFESTKEFINYLWSGAGHLWFLLMMFTTFLLFYRFEDFLLKHIKFGLTLSIILYVLPLFFNYVGLNPIGLVSRYFIFFYLGNIVNRHSDYVLSFLKGKVIIFFTLHLVLFIIYFYSIQQFENKYVLFIIDKALLLLSLLALAFIYGSLDVFIKEFPKVVKRISSKVSFINHTSYYIYLIHEPFLKVFFTWILIRNLPAFIAIPLAFAMALTLSAILGYLIMKTKIGKELIGG